MNFFSRLALAAIMYFVLLLKPLPSFGNSDTLRIWSDQLHSDMKEQSAQAALTLMQMDTDEALSLLKAFIVRPGCPFQNQHIGVVLERKLTPRLTAALLPAIRAGRETFSDEAFCAVQILRLAETRDIEARSALIDYAKGRALGLDPQSEQEDDRYRAWGVAALKNYNDPDVLSALIEIAGTGRPRSKAAAVYALGEIGHPSAIDALLQKLQSQIAPCATPDTCDDKKALLEALGKTGDQRAVEPIMAVLKSQETHKAVRKKALEALEKLNVPGLQRF